MNIDAKPLQNVRRIEVSQMTWKDISKGLSRDKPSIYILELRDTGQLKEILPEIDSLFGIPQPAEHHPEIDTGIHTLMVLDRAAELTDNIDVRFAALVHDVGKALTSSETWPKHHNHEELGVESVKKIAERLEIPEETAELAVYVARYHLQAHRAFEARPGTLVKLFENTNAFTQPERFELFVLATQADAQGRLHHETVPYPQASFLMSALQAALNVNTNSLSDDVIRQDRIRCVTDLKKNLSIEP